MTHGKSVCVLNILDGEGNLWWNLFHDPKFRHVLEENIKEQGITWWNDEQLY